MMQAGTSHLPTLHMCCSGTAATPKKDVLMDAPCRITYLGRAAGSGGRARTPLGRPRGAGGPEVGTLACRACCRPKCLSRGTSLAGGHTLGAQQGLQVVRAHGGEARDLRLHCRPVGG